MARHPGRGRSAPSDEKVAELRAEIEAKDLRIKDLEKELEVYRGMFI